jgi:ureidoglycolate dehydrogenase (NAD+)
MATVTIQAEEAKRLVIKQLTKVGLNEETAGKYWFMLISEMSIPMVFCEQSIM